MSEKKLPYYERYVLTREFILRSEQLPVDPTCVDRVLDRPVDESVELWNEYYAIFDRGEYGDELELVEDGDKFPVMSVRFEAFLYEKYKEDYAPLLGEPLSFDDWKKTEYEEILNKLFPNRK